MIIRYGGGNSGIKEYLEEGRKADRHFSRDELDRRIPVEGDLNFTDSVISSIPNKDQDRYLHISLSFNEPDITEEKMAEVFQQYKKELFAAYGEDEFDVYAEIHWPKIKEAYNHKTKQMEPRYPHLHVVVPKRNLLTGGMLNPIGMHERSVKYLDAIQEKLNRDNGLSSPRNSPRVGSNHYESALGKYTDKEFRGKNGETKRSIHEQIQARDIRSVSDFKSLVSEYGEVRIRNQGKDSQYLAVKVPGDQKFTNLKGNIFNLEYIENRNLVLPPISDAQVKRRLDTWRDIKSREIKYISNASTVVKDKYRVMTLAERREFLIQRESDYEQKHRAEQSAPERPAGGRRELASLSPGDYQSGDFEFTRGVEAQGEGDLHELRAGNVDNFGSEGVSANRLFLQGDENHDVSERVEPDRNAGLRHNLYAGSREGGIEFYTNPRSSVVASMIEDEADLAAQAKAQELAWFAEIRKELDPSHLLSYCQINYGVDPAGHPVTTAKDGSARIRVGKYNYNVSDFLTKYIKLDWSEASEVLTSLYDKQQSGLVERPKTREQHIEDWRTFRDDIYPKKIRTFDELKNQIKISYSLGVKSINAEYWTRRKSITLDQSLSRQEKHYFRSIVILDKLQKIEELKRQIDEQNSLTTRVKYPYSALFYNHAVKNEEATMKVLDKLKGQFSKDAEQRESENSIGSPEKTMTPAALPTGAEAARRAKLVAQMQLKEREAAELKIKIADLRPQPLATGGVAFCVKDNGKQIFVNHPDRLELNKVTEPDEVGVALIYATERFGSPLDIKGTDDFKQQVIEVAAERDMDVTFIDEAMNRALNDKRIELGLEPLQGNTIEVAELEIDKTLPLNEAVDKALLQSKVDELAQLPASNSADREISLGVVADAKASHEEITSGLASDERIAELAQEDLVRLSQLEGRAEQVDMAVAVGAVMANQQYREYMAEHAPEEFGLTLDAAKVVHQQKEMEAAIKGMSANEAQAVSEDIWDNSIKDEDGFTNAMHTAMEAGRELQEIPDEIATDNELLNAYKHGLEDQVREIKAHLASYDGDGVALPGSGPGADLDEAGRAGFEKQIALGEKLMDGVKEKTQRNMELSAASRDMAKPEQLAAARPEPLVFTHEGQPVVIDLERFQAQPAQTEAAQGQQDARLLATAATAEQISERLAGSAARWQSDEYRDAFVYEAQQLESEGQTKVELAPLIRQLDGTDKRLQFEHEGKPVVVDLERFTAQQPQTEAAQGQQQARLVAAAATPQLVAAYMVDAASRWQSDEYRDAFVYEAQQLESAGEAKVELSPLIRQLDGTDKNMSALDVKFVHEGQPVVMDLERFQPSEPAEDPSIDAIMRRAAVIEAQERHHEIKDGLASPERVKEIAAQDLEAYSVVVGYPEQAELANSMGQMQHNTEYKVFMNNNAPTSFASSIAAATPQPVPDLSIKPKGSDMEM